VFFEELRRACVNQLELPDEHIRWNSARPAKCLRDLATLLERSFARVTLILDQYERIENLSLDRAIADFSTGLAGNLSLIIASRRKIRIPFGERRLGGGVTRLDQEDLRYSDEEIRQLFPNYLAPADFSRLSDWSEGWPIAVHLARTSLVFGNGDDSTQYLRLSTAEAEICDYIVDEIVGALAPSHCRLLVETSFLDRFNAELVEAVTETTGAWQVLQEMHAANLVSVDGSDDDRQYRCHHLLRQVLLADLRRQGKREVSRRRLAAAGWLQQNGDMIGAIRQAHAAGDVELVASLILSLDATMFGAIYGAAELSAVMEHLPTQALHRFPRLILAKAYLEAKSGNVEAAAEIVRNVRAQAASPGEADDRLLIRDLAIAESAISMYNGRGLLPSDLKNVEMIQESCRNDDNSRALVNNLLCVIAFNSSDLPEALSRCESAMHFYVGQKSQNGLGYIHIHMGRIFAEMGEAEKAIQHYLEGREHFMLRTAGDNRSIGLGAIFLAQTLYDRGQIDEALLSCASFSREGEHGGYYSEGVYAGYRTLAMIKRLTAGSPDAVHELDHGIAFARTKRNANLERLLILEQILMEPDAALLAERVREAEPLLSDPQAGKEPEANSWRLGDLRAMALAKVEAVQQNLCSALAILDERACECERQGRVRTLIDLLVRIAIIHDARKQRENALAAMRRAVGLAWKGGIVSPFVENGIDAASLLNLLANSFALKRADQAEFSFVHQIVRRCAELGSKAASVLSPREREVLHCLSRGMNNKLIARALEISPETVRFHLKAIYQKFGVKNGRANRCVVADFASARELIN
jgi:LuxR family maltose regulon positive regulatory protein